MKSNLFLELNNSPLFKSHGVTRYSTVTQLRPESLSDHVYDVLTLSYLLARKLITDCSQSVDVGLLCEKCILHDSMDEPLIGDIPRLTKYSSEECHTALSHTADMVARRVSDQIDGTDYSYEIWKNDKDSTVEGQLLKITDMLSVAQKAIMEVDLLGNKYFLKVLDEVSYYLKDMSKSLDKDLFNTKAHGYLVGVIDDAYEITHEISMCNRSITRKYDMYDDITDCIVESGLNSRENC